MLLTKICKIENTWNKKPIQFMKKMNTYISTDQTQLMAQHYTGRSIKNRSLPFVISSFKKKLTHSVE